MSKTVKVQIDGKAVKVPDGTTILEAAEKAGVHIPNFCYIKGMRGIGACRMCLVEVEGGRGPVTACTAKVKEDMIIQTNTENLQEMRRFVLDLILSMHPLDCMTCTKAGVCSLQQYAYDAGIQESTFTRKDFGYPVDTANPFIKRDPDYCILCGKCVRVCKEQGTNVLEFMGRGVGAKVITANDRPLQESDCTFCGSCVDACPVNALLEADRWRKGREWEYQKSNSVCLSCGNGCDITVSIKDKSVTKINTRAEDESSTKYICAIGRFGFDALLSDQRITSPMKRVGDELQETTWEDALAIVAKKFTSSGSKTGVISSAAIMNEDAEALASFVSGVLKAKNVDTTVSLYADPAVIQSSDTVDMESSDLILLVGLSPSQWERRLPALDASIRKRVARGAKLVVVNTDEHNADEIAAVSLKGDEAAMLASVAKSLVAVGKTADKALEPLIHDIETTEESDKAAELLTSATSAVIFCEPSLFNASRNISILSGASVVAVPLESNARGVIAAGLTETGKTSSEMIEGKTPALYVIGEVPFTDRPDTKFLVVQTSYMSDLAREADVVLPSASFLESSGSIIHYLGKTKKVHKTSSPAGQAKQHRDIYADVAEAMGSKLRAKKVAVKKTAKAAGKANFMPFEKKRESSIEPAGFIASVNSGIIRGSRLLWLTEAEKAGV